MADRSVREEDDLALRALREGLRAAVDVAGSAEALASRSGVQRRTLDNYLGGRTSPKALAIAQIAEAIGKSSDWIMNGGIDSFQSQVQRTQAQASRNAPVYIRRFDVRMSAGSGAFTDQSSEMAPIPFTADFFSKKLGRNKKDMVIVEASGDSMLPSVGDGDLLMVDTSDTVIKDGIMAVSYDGELFVKRVVRNPGKIELLSDNKLYPPVEISGAEVERLKPIGRVVWIGRLVA